MKLIGTCLIFSLLSVTKVLSVQLCGKALADMMDLVCAGRGFHWVSTDGVPTISKRSAVQYLTEKDRPMFKRGGVVSECCKQTCTMANLESYCASDIGVYRSQTTSLLDEEQAIKVLQSEQRPQNQDKLSKEIKEYRPSETQSQLIMPSNSPRKMVQSNMMSKTTGKMRYNKNRNSFFFVRPVGRTPTRMPVEL